MVGDSLDGILFKRTGQGKKEKKERTKAKVSFWRSAQEKRSKCLPALKSTRQKTSPRHRFALLIALLKGPRALKVRSPRVGGEVGVRRGVVW